MDDTTENDFNLNESTMKSYTCEQLGKVLLQNNSDDHYINDYVSRCVTQLQRSISTSIYLYTMPLIFIIGFCGNLLSLRVFLFAPMRHISATVYLAALSMSDLFVLITFGLLKWLDVALGDFVTSKDGPVLGHDGVCQTFEYVVHVARFISAWCIVVFTIERYVAVCHPLHRRVLCTRRAAYRIICLITTSASIICVYKPFVVEVNSDKQCYYKDGIVIEVFVLESIYGLLITAVPFLIMTILNLCILATLSKARKLQRTTTREKTPIRTEFTLILLGVSTCFVCLNMPYFIIWCCSMVHQIKHMGSNPERIDNPYAQQYLIAKTLFCCNYCVNFFLYCFSGSFYKKELNKLLQCQNKRPTVHSRFSTRRSCTYSSTPPLPRATSSGERSVVCVNGYNTCKLQTQLTFNTDIDETVDSLAKSVNRQESSGYMSTLI